ncbi:hypothetical protein EGW08_006578, partial [Elysia chlorotica]
EPVDPQSRSTDPPPSPPYSSLQTAVSQSLQCLYWLPTTKFTHRLTPRSFITDPDKNTIISKKYYLTLIISQDYLTPLDIKNLKETPSIYYCIFSFQSLLKVHKTVHFPQALKDFNTWLSDSLTWTSQYPCVTIPI